MEMGDRMAGAISETLSMGSFATPEVRGLFEEWARIVEEEIAAFVREKVMAKPADIAAKLKISEESALYFIGKMAREKKLEITGVTL
jgi:hypothetical protein